MSTRTKSTTRQTSRSRGGSFSQGSPMDYYTEDWQDDGSSQLSMDSYEGEELLESVPRSRPKAKTRTGPSPVGSSPQYAQPDPYMMNRPAAVLGKPGLPKPKPGSKVDEFGGSQSNTPKTFTGVGAPPRSRQPPPMSQDPQGGYSSAPKFAKRPPSSGQQQPYGQTYNPAPPQSSIRFKFSAAPAHLDIGQCKMISRIEDGEEWQTQDLLNLQDELRRLHDNAMDRKVSAQHDLAKMDDYYAQISMMESEDTLIKKKKSKSGVSPATTIPPSFVDSQQQDLKRRDDVYGGGSGGQPDPKKMKKESGGVKRKINSLQDDGEHEYDFGQQQDATPIIGGGKKSLSSMSSGRGTLNSASAAPPVDYGFMDEDQEILPEDEDDFEFKPPKESTQESSLSTSGSSRFSGTPRTTTATTSGGGGGSGSGGGTGKLKKKASVISSSVDNKIKKVLEKNKIMKPPKRAPPPPPKPKDKKKKKDTPSEPADAAPEESEASDEDSDNDDTTTTTSGHNGKSKQNLSPQQQFWGLVNSFFTPLSESELRKVTVESHLSESDPIFFIPALGKHYLDKWTEETKTKSRYDEDEVLYNSSPYELGKLEEDHNSPLTVSCAHLTQNAMLQSIPPANAREVDVLNAELAFQGPTLAQRILACLVEENLLDVILSTKENDRNAADNASAIAASAGGPSPRSLSPTFSAGSVFPHGGRASSVKSEDLSATGPVAVTPFDYNCDLMMSVEENLLREMRDIGIPTDTEQFDIKNREDDEVCVELRALHQRLREQLAENNRAKQAIRSIVSKKLAEEAARNEQAKINQKVVEEYNALIQAKKPQRKGKKAGGPTIKPPPAPAAPPPTRRQTAAAGGLEKRSGGGGGQTSPVDPLGPSFSGGGRPASSAGGNLPHPLPGTKQRQLDSELGGTGHEGPATYSVGKPLTLGARQRAGGSSRSGGGGSGGMGGAQSDQIANELSAIQVWIANLSSMIMSRKPLNTHSYRLRADEKLKRLQILAQVGLDVQREFANDLTKQVQNIIDSNFDPTLLSLNGGAPLGMPSQDQSVPSFTPLSSQSGMFSEQGTPLQTSPEPVNFMDSQGSMYPSQQVYEDGEEEEEEIVVEEDEEEEGGAAQGGEQQEDETMEEAQKSSPPPTTLPHFGGKQQASSMVPSGKGLRGTSTKGRPRYQLPSSSAHVPPPPPAAYTEHYEDQGDSNQQDSYDMNSEYNEQY